jgi:hypothetical protein
MSLVNADNITAGTEAAESRVAAQAFLEAVKVRRDAVVNSDTTIFEKIEAADGSRSFAAGLVDAGVMAVLEVLDGKDGGAGYMAAIRPVEGNDMDYSPVDLGSELSEIWLDINKA